MTCGLVLVERVGRLVSLHKIANNLFTVQVTLPWTPEGGGRLEGNYKGRGRSDTPTLYQVTTCFLKSALLYSSGQSLPCDYDL